MSELSGSLEDFPLPDVLRLLSKGKKDGVLHMYGDVVRGRVYLNDGRISYATTRESDDFAEGRGSEARTAEDRRRVQLGAVNDDDPQLLNDVLRLQIVEVLVRLARETSGSFVFQNGVAPQEAAKEPFSVDELLMAAEAELKEWQRIEAIIGTTSTPLQMVTGVAESQKITLDGAAWNALAALGAGDSTRGVAERLNVFEIVAARVMARLVEDGLVEVARDPKAAEPPISTEPIVEEAAPEEEPSPEVHDRPIIEQEPEDHHEVEFSEEETREVLSALSRRDDDPDDDDTGEAAEDSPRSARDLGFEGLDDEPKSRRDDIAPGETDEAPPASELARRWRNLRAGAGD